MDDDSCFMKRALDLSLLGRPTPNPYVGAVIVKNGKIIGEGYHGSYGNDHAEVAAIKDVYSKNGQRAPDMLEGSTMYVTLEPCNHQGKTPPCTQAIINEGILRVVFCIKDDNPTVTGGGSVVLQEAGITVDVGVLEDEAEKINAAYLKRCRSDRPYVSLKMAQTLDGMAATSKGDSKWISCEKSRKLVHKYRSKVSAVMVGIGTVLADDPRLDCRLDGYAEAQPKRIIIDQNLRIPLDAKVFADSNAIVVCSKDADEEKVQYLVQRDIMVLRCQTDENGKIDLEHMFIELARMDIDHIMCEGGPTLASSLLEKGLVDEMLFFIAPKLLGGTAMPVFRRKGILEMGNAVGLEFVEERKVGEDILICAIGKDSSFGPSILTAIR